MKKNKSPSGFTLIELLVAIGIIIILGALAVAALNLGAVQGQNERHHE